jgi:hypothetical protein
MNLQEVPELLKQISYADPRILREDPAEQRGQVAMWASVLKDVPLQFAMDAIGEHYAQSPFPVLPADIAAKWKAETRRRLERHIEQPPHADPEDELAYRRQLHAQRKDVATGRARIHDVKELTDGFAKMPEHRERPYLPDHIRRQFADALTGWGERKFLHPEMAVDCPYCKARVGKPCRTPTRHRELQDTHPSRKDAYRANPPSDRPA